MLDSHRDAPDQAPGPELLGSARQVAGCRMMAMADGPGRGLRVCRLDVDGGVSLELSIDRGCDVIGAWFGGRSLAWQSPVGVVGPPSGPPDQAWLRGFAGGLVSTCGIDNVGAPSEGLPLHGSIGNQPAAEVTTGTEVVDGRPAAVVTGVISDVTALGRHIEIRRRIVSQSGRGHVLLEDRVANRGSGTEPIPLLYHMNFGWPVWAPGSSLTSTAGWVEPVAGFDGDVDDWRTAPEPLAGGEQSVFDHLPYPNQTIGLRLDSPTADLTLGLSWSNDSLPRCTQWVHPGAGIYALGLEPCNASVLGRGHDRQEGRLPELAPGAERVMRIELTVESLTS